MEFPSLNSDSVICPILSALNKYYFPPFKTFAKLFPPLGIPAYLFLD